jgi:hypothetical protein
MILSKDFSDEVTFKLLFESALLMLPEAIVQILPSMMDLFTTDAALFH